MRPPHESVERSATPIYDALYAEYRRLFRALPGDRTGEEELEFTAFRLYEEPEPRHEPRRAGRHRGGQPALPPGSGFHGPYGNRMREL